MNLSTLNVRRNTSKDSHSKEEDYSTIPDLKIDVSIFREHIKQKFKQLITSIDSENIDSKLLVVDRSIYDVFRFLFTKNELGVSRIAFFNEELRTDLKYLIFLIPPHVSNMNKLAHILKHNPNKSIHVVFLPRATFTCKEALQLLGVYGSINSMIEFNFDLIPLDYDLLSLEIPEACRLLYYELDAAPLALIAESIQRIQSIYGKIQNVFCKGYTSKVIFEMLKNIEKEEKAKPEETTEIASEIDYLVIFDRNLDYITPLLTQFTYSGALDETWGIKQNTFISLDKKFFPVNTIPQPEGGAANPNPDIIVHKLKKDKIFIEIRDCHTAAVAEILDQKLGEIKSLNDEMAAGSKQNTIKEMAKNAQKERKILEKDFDKVATHVEVRRHLDELMAKPAFYKQVKVEQSIVNGDMKPQEILDYIEAQINRQAPLMKVLKLLCLHSLVENGLKNSTLDSLKKDIQLAYGFEHFLTLNNLEKVGLLKHEGDRKIWDGLSKQLNLISPDIQNLLNPEDASYAYFGYCPVFVRLVENLFKKGGWDSIKGALETLPGSTIIQDKRDKTQTQAAQAQNSANPGSNKEVVLVYMVGGVTYGELAGFRHLAKTYNKQIIVATTSLITGDRLVNSIFEKPNKA